MCYTHIWSYACPPLHRPEPALGLTLMGVNIKSYFGIMRLGLASQAFSKNPTFPGSISIDLCFSKIDI